MAILKIIPINKDGVMCENVFHASTNILKTSYNYGTKQLVSTFKNGGVYLYNDLPNEVYEDFKNADSSGVFLNSTIKNNYTAVKKGTLVGEPMEKLLIEIEEYKKGDL